MAWSGDTGCAEVSSGEVGFFDLVDLGLAG